MEPIDQDETERSYTEEQRLAKLLSWLKHFPWFVFGGGWIVICLVTNSASALIWGPTVAFAAIYASGAISSINSWDKSCLHALIFLTAYFAIWLVFGLIFGFSDQVVIWGNAFVGIGSFIHVFIWEARRSRRAWKNLNSSIK